MNSSCTLYGNTKIIIMRKIIFGLLTAAILVCSCQGQKNDFVRVENGKFVSNEYPSHFVGTNFWYGPILGSETEGGDRERLAQELDLLKENGLVNLRVLVGADGPDGEFYRICPTLQKSPGVYNEDMFAGLDYFMAELGKRGMKAVLYINNSWEWSGGYGMYLEWSGDGKALLPLEAGYREYCEEMSKFVMSDKAKQLYYNHVKNVVSRVNSVTGKPYKEDPAIFSWQIGNEPRCFSRDPEVQAKFAEWMWESAALIKSIDPNHMVSSGSEGYNGCEQNYDLFEKIHSCPDIDYMNIHIWPYNWRWVTQNTLDSELNLAIQYTDEYIDEHLAIAEKYGKPVVLEEFGYPRDGVQYAMSSTVAARDKYYAHVMQRMVEAAREGSLLAGVNFWAWGGLAGQSDVNLYWRPGDDYCGDPAQEPQGLYSVYASDESTVKIIREAAHTTLEAVQGK